MTSDVTAGAVAEAVGEHRGAVAVLIDGDGRFAGTISREIAGLAPAKRMAGEVGQDSPCIGESASLADPIDSMVKTHRRSFRVIGADGRVTGVLADVDMLRKITESKRL